MQRGPRTYQYPVRNMQQARHRIRLIIERLTYEVDQRLRVVLRKLDDPSKNISVEIWKEGGAPVFRIGDEVITDQRVVYQRVAAALELTD